MTARKKGLCPAVVAVDGLGAEWDKRRSAERVAINDLTISCDIDESNVRWYR